MKDIALDGFKANTRQFKSHVRGKLSVDANRSGQRTSGEKNSTFIPPKYAALMNRGQDSNLQDRSQTEGFLTGRPGNSPENTKRHLEEE